VLPHTPDARIARAAARSAASHGVLRCINARVRWRDLCESEPIAMDVRAQLGPVCEKLLYEVYRVRGDYAQTMRLGLLDPSLQQPALQAPATTVPAMVAVAGQSRGGGQGHRPLRYRLLMRSLGQRPA
jgi:hypothetical protein